MDEWKKVVDEASEWADVRAWIKGDSPTASTVYVNMKDKHSAVELGEQLKKVPGVVRVRVQGGSDWFIDSEREEL